MKPSRSIRPISYLKANAAQIIRGFESDPGTILITQNGVAKAVLQDLRTYEDTQEALALLRILAMGADEIRTGNVKPVARAFASIRKRVGGSS